MMILMSEYDLFAAFRGYLDVDALGECAENFLSAVVAQEVAVEIVDAKSGIVVKKRGRA